MKKWLSGFLLPMMLVSTQVIAGGVTIGGTRLIYDGSKKDAVLNVTNTDNSPYLIQSWVEPQEASTLKAPFIITPPLFRLDGNEQNLLRVVRTGGSLPEDRESLYWLNVKAIPSSGKNENVNTLQIAVRSRIKLIYRPQGLNGVPEDVTGKLSWSRSASKLTVTNPTPFVMNFQSVKVGTHDISDATLVMPQSQSTFTVPNGVSGKISWRLISDYGGIGVEHSN